MASEGQSRQGPARDRSGRIWVEDAGRRRPFMRGIMIHSLMARGVPFERAFQAANEIRDELRGRDVVSKQEIAKAVRDRIGEAAFVEESRVALPPAMHVVSGGQRRPFSKGILSQSLLAAALDPNQAFDVAREIERQLLERGAPEVDRTELREIAHAALESSAGPNAAERYLVWRRREEAERPLVLLLGGASGVGKTSLALEVAYRLGIGRVLSTDSIRQIMRLTLSQSLAPALHASSYDAWKVLPPESLGDDPVIDGFRAQAATVAVGARASLDRAVAENASMVLDGVSILPGLIDLEGYSETADVIYLVVAALEEEAFRERFARRALTARWRPPHKYLENLDAILRVQEHYLELADRHDIPIIDNVSFDRSVLSIIRHVIEALRKREGRDGSD